MHCRLTVRVAILAGDLRTFGRSFGVVLFSLISEARFAHSCFRRSGPVGNAFSAVAGNILHASRLHGGWTLCGLPTNASLARGILIAPSERNTS